MPRQGDDAGTLRELNRSELEGVQGGWRFWPPRPGKADVPRGRLGGW